MKRMPASKIGLNNSALVLVNKLIDEADRYGISVEKEDEGATLIDAGFKEGGGFLAGEIVAEICLGGNASVKVLPVQYEDLVFPSAFVHTNHPALSTLASQRAGWQIETDQFSAIGSGPARILALEPRDLYERLGCKEDSDVGVLVLETSLRPSKTALQYIAVKCKIEPANLFVVYFSHMSMTNAIQSSARIVETGLFKLMTQGLDPWKVKHAWGCAPVLPFYPNQEEDYGRKNIAISCGGTAHYFLNFEDEEKLRNIVRASSDSTSKMLEEANRLVLNNRHYSEILKEAGLDFQYGNSVLAPAVIMVSNQKTGKVFRAGSLDIETLKQSFGLT
jgi:methenyltetrahydromethanopterin cyclohydrolase